MAAPYASPAARYSRITHDPTRRLLRAGTLFGVPLGGRAGWRVSRSAAEELLGGDADKGGKNEKR
jgi:hypothetical protein